MKTKNSGVVLLLGAMSFAASMTVMAGSIESDPIDSGQQIAAKNEHVLGVCDIVNVNGNGQVSASPMTLANAYFRTHDATIDPGTAKVTIFQQPKYGSLEPDSRGDWRYAKYIPNDGYLGDDSFVMQVEGSGYTVKLKYFIAVTEDKGMTLNPNPVCKGQIWKISKDTNGNSILTVVNFPSSTTSTSAANTTTLASTLGSSVLSNLATQSMGSARLIHKSNWEDGYSQTPPHGHGDRKSEKFVINRT